MGNLKKVELSPESIAHMECDYVEASNRIDYSKRGAKESTLRIKDYLAECGVQIVDQIGDAYSSEFCEKIASLLEEKYACKASIGKRVKNEALNICV